MATSHPPHFAPGTKHRYSNTNYIVLGLVVEAVTGDSLTAEMGRRIFQPLGLRASSFDATAARVTGRHAHGYAPIGRGGRVVELNVLSSSLTWAAGALVSTAGDVARFYRALLQGRLLRPDLLREMGTTVPAGPPGEGYGLGLIETRRLDVETTYRLPCADSVWGHDGSFAGWNSYAYNSADGRRQMVVLINSDTLSAKGVRALAALRDGVLRLAALALPLCHCQERSPPSAPHRT